MARIEPTKEWLAESRRRLSVPEEWVWGWCENCDLVVWYPPLARETTLAMGKRWSLVCSSNCQTAILDKWARERQLN